MSCFANIEVAPFDPQHLDGFQGREGDGPGEISAGLAIWRQFHGVGFTAIHDGRVLGCAGWIVIRPSVAYPWAIFSEEIKSIGKWLHRAAWRYGQRALDDLGIDLMEVHIEEHSRRNRRWAASFGFRLATPVERIVDARGKTYIKHVLYVRRAEKAA